MTKKTRYDEEELEILKALEAGVLSSRDLKHLQARALEEGIPYQTLAASLLHKYVSGLLVNQR